MCAVCGEGGVGMVGCGCGVSEVVVIGNMLFLYCKFFLQLQD